jgi:hypothetical protein
LNHTGACHAEISDDADQEALPLTRIRTECAIELTRLLQLYDRGAVCPADLFERVNTVLMHAAYASTLLRNSRPQLMELRRIAAERPGSFNTVSLRHPELSVLLDKAAAEDDQRSS